ncbi:MAG: hypothetical protein VYB38_00025 [Bacteroidota bacterium]|nr:hypothetical protein [Leeuwenhoekiella sp.]MEC7781761.1 hypothetical protein [Bacteroidota bacterium]MEE3149048.1 hypothetical protein [Bacteroidota bacterium]MEE3226760.1 hypothetical protein [Bacteroidota bacterium]MEE3244600.1 hypothetical protein [Bacteroidota bacterium]|tara:strand:- start:4584 stop:4844 length:261 start_codon:yes stop_codon:yes gene_type:complete
MNLVDWLGAIGVFQILLAYILNVTGKIAPESWSFILLNFIGATIACTASVLLDYLPFVILEGVWALTSLITFIKKIISPRNKNHEV